MGKQRRGSTPQKLGPNTVTPRTQAPNYDDATPRFCFGHLQRGYGVKDLEVEAQASLARELEVRSTMRWREITLAHRHGNGSETLPAGQIRPQVPHEFSDVNKFLVLRYQGKRPMVGVRINDTFHVVWIERDFGDVYDHG